MKNIIVNSQLLIVNWKRKIYKFFNQQLAINNQQSAFTLLELIIAMAIVAILSGALWGNFFTSITKGRDSRRKQDLDTIAKALELYYTDNRAYPTAFPGVGTPFVNPNNAQVVYLQKTPSDPAYPNATYCYPTIAAGTFFKMYANLENTSDPKIIPTISCGGVNYNYGVSSANTTP